MSEMSPLLFHLNTYDPIAYQGEKLFPDIFSLRRQCPEAERQRPPAGLRGVDTIDEYRRAENVVSPNYLKF